MPVLRDFPLKLERDEILRRQGFGSRAGTRPQIHEITAELLDMVESDTLIGPVASYEMYAITGMDADRVSLEGGGAVNGSLIPTHFPEAGELVALVCTIGPALEDRVTEYSRSGETLRGMLLDGIGSAAVDMLALESCRRIAGMAAESGHQTSSPVNPGMPGLPITEQGPILELAHADDIGVSLTSSGIMVPRKSTSLIIGIGPQMETWTQDDVCARCNLRETCPYKVHG